MTDTREETQEAIVVLRKGRKSAFVPRKKFYGEKNCQTAKETPMPFKASAFFGDTMLLTHEQRSSYVMLLVATWMRVRPLPDDNAFLGKICGMTENRFAKYVRGEIERFFEIRDGYWRPSSGHVEDPKSRRMNNTEWMTLRRFILSRDNYTCTYCGRKMPDVKIECDHIIPLSRGGSNDPENLTAACFECNSSKRGKLLEEWKGDAS